MQGFDEIATGAVRVGALHVLGVVGGGEYEHGNALEAPVALHPLEYLPAVQASEVQVQEDESWTRRLARGRVAARLGQELQGLLSLRAAIEGVEDGGRLEGHLEHVEVLVVVLHDEDGQLVVHRMSSVATARRTTAMGPFSLPRVKKKVVPSPGEDANHMRPLCRSMMRLTMVSPVPVPPPYLSRP